MSQATAFANPVFDSQTAFRATMNAMARPGSIHRLELAFVPPAALPVSAAAVLLSLCDFETSLWVSPKVPDWSVISDFMTFHTGALKAKSPDQAQFALVNLATEALSLSEFAQGTPEYPDRSTTIIAIAPSLTGGAARILSGPGVNGTAEISVSGLGDDFLSKWAANRAAYPLGVDLIFCEAASLLALPRSTRVKGF